MAGFGLPNFGQLTEAFKKAQEIQQNAQALQAAYEQSTATMKGRMEELTGGLNLKLPGMGG